MKQLEALSIVVPTLNEAGNMQQLLQRIDAPLCKAGVLYEVVVIDDHSSDNTVQITEGLAAIYPVRVSIKQGKRGKAFSLLQGFDEAKYPLVLMIDADLQYPPEEIMPMYRLLESTKADVITTRRQVKDVSMLRKVFSKVYNFIFAKLLFGIDFDTQSGLKLFRKPILNTFKMNPSPWSFDLEFLVRALENKFKIISHNITFSEREAGVTKIKLFSSTLELATAALKLRWRTSAPKTRAGYQANVRFVKRAFPVIIVTLFSVLALSVSSQRASALSLTDTVQGTTSLVSGVLNSVVNILAPTTPSPSQGSSSTTTAPPSNTSGTTAASQPTASNGSNASSIAPASRGSSGASAATTNAAQPATNSLTQNTGNKQASILSNTTPKSDGSKLSAITAMNTTGSLYSSGYPNYKLSASTASKLNAATGIAWIVGIGCIASIFVAYKRNREPQQDVRI